MTNLNFDHLLTSNAICLSRGSNNSTRTQNLPSKIIPKEYKLQCSICNKFFANQKTLGTHSSKYHKEFTRNGTTFSVNDNVRNSDSLFLSDFNLSVCSKQEDKLDHLNTGLNESGIINDVSNLNHADFQNRTTNFLKNFSKNLIISSLNINSLQHKFSHISFILDQQLVDILVLNETKLNSTHCNSQFENVNYQMIRRDRGSGGGGIMVYIKKSIKTFNAQIDDDNEIITLTFTPKDKTHLGLIACYRPPHANNVAQFFSSLEQKVIDLETSTSETFIVGDLNFNLINKESNGLTDFMITNGFYNTIFKGTRLNSLTQATTLLDVILCYYPQNLLSSEVIPCPVSDHAAIFSVFDFKLKKNKPKNQPARCLSTIKISNICASLFAILSLFTFQSMNVNTQWSLIKDIINSCINDHAPLKYVPKKKRNNIPWVDKEYLKKCSKRDKIYYNIINKCKNNTDSFKKEWMLYKKIRNDCSTLFHKKKSSYFSKFIESESVSSKKLWKKLSPHISPNNKPALNPSLILKKETSNPDLELSNTFCNFFSTITSKFTFKPIDLCIKYSTNLFKTNSNFGTLDDDDGFELELFNISEIEKGLKNLKPNTGAGEVGIESIVLINGAEELRLAITNLFNLIIKTHTFPDEWKCAHISPIYKGKGSKSSLDNYRPISIIPPIAKLFESLIATKIYDYLENNNLIHSSQFGFRKSRSCELALNSMVEDWKKSLDSKKEVITMFLDLSKAFDTVDHQLLIHKLKFFKFKSSLIKLIENYLTDRSIRVNINNTLSKKKSITVGVPQGSVLGPLLFIMYTNDMSLLKLHSSSWLFADDTTIALDGTSIIDIINKIQEDLAKIIEWLNSNKLLINLKKSQIMHLPSTCTSKKILHLPSTCKTHCNIDPVSKKKDQR